MTDAQILPARAEVSTSAFVAMHGNVELIKISLDGAVTFDWPLIEVVAKDERSYQMVRVLCQVATAARQQAATHCWKTINSAIVQGPLSGNGLDKNAERNGVVLAANLIFPLAFPPPVQDEKPYEQFTGVSG